MPQRQQHGTLDGLLGSGGKIGEDNNSLDTHDKLLGSEYGQRPAGAGRWQSSTRLLRSPAGRQGLWQRNGRPGGADDAACTVVSGPGD
ncbi:hypothetical protein GCM10027019_17530 [Melaminivora jejuensis]